MGRPTKDDRRHDYLDIGASHRGRRRTARSRDEAGLALAHVRLAEVAERAGVTKGALYHIWPSQEAFWSDLLDHLMAEQRLAGIERVKEVVAEVEAFPGRLRSTCPGTSTPSSSASATIRRSSPGSACTPTSNDEATRGPRPAVPHVPLDRPGVRRAGIGLMGRRMRGRSSIDDLMIAADRAASKACASSTVSTPTASRTSRSTVVAGRCSPSGPTR